VPSLIKDELKLVHNKSQEEFEDIKGVIRSRKSKDRQHNGQKKNDKEQQLSTKHHREN